MLKENLLHKDPLLGNIGPKKPTKMGGIYLYTQHVIQPPGERVISHQTVSYVAHVEDFPGTIPGIAIVSFLKIMDRHASSVSTLQTYQSVFDILFHYLYMVAPPINDCFTGGHIKYLHSLKYLSKIT